MAVNQEMFRKIDRVLIDFPELHYQSTWETDWLAMPASVRDGHCGTTRCVAGWGVFFKAQEMGLVSRKRDGVTLSIREQVAESIGLDGREPDYTEMGAKILGLDPRHANDLFDDFDGARVQRRVHELAEHGTDSDYDDADYEE